jgi:hypothetical protein
VSLNALDHMVACQDAMIAALDSNDAAMIERATCALASALGQLQGQGAWHTEASVRATLDHAIKQSDAARIRVNCLSHTTRQRIDRMAALRGGGSSSYYNIT